jgi:hypothetical protein
VTVTYRACSTAEPGPAGLAQLLDLFAAAWPEGDFSRQDMEHACGGRHSLVLLDARDGAIRGPDEELALPSAPAQPPWSAPPRTGIPVLTAPSSKAAWMVIATPATPPLTLRETLGCEWRPGDAW